MTSGWRSTRPAWGTARLRRPALPHVGAASTRWPRPRRSCGPPRSAGSRTSRSPTTSRIDGALEARSAAPDGPDGHRRRGGPDRRRRSDRAVPAAAAVAPAPPGGRDDRRGPGAGRAGGHPASRSTASAARCCAMRRWRRWLAARRLDRGPQRADRRRDGNERAAEFAREHGLPGVAVSDAHTRSRSASRTPRSTATRRRRRAARGAGGRRELVTGRASSTSARSRRSRSSSSGCAADRADRDQRPTDAVESGPVPSTVADDEPPNMRRPEPPGELRPRPRPAAAAADAAPGDAPLRCASRATSSCRSAAGCGSRARSSR